MIDSSRVLLICDDEQVARYLREQLIVEGNCTVYTETSIQGGVWALKQNPFDVIIIRYGMRNFEVEEAITGFKKIDPESIVIAYVDVQGSEIPDDLFKLGFYDFIKKPISSEKLLFLVKKAAQTHSLMIAGHKLTQGLREHNAALEKQNILLAKRIEESTKNLTRLYEDLRSTYMRTIKVLAQAIDAKDHYTHSHSENVAKYAVAIASEMGLSAKDTETIREACELHDLGKIGIEDSILTKPGSLTPQEWEQIKRHPSIGAQILEPLTFLTDVIDLVRQHHERYDGKGYPDGIRGEDILLGARVINLSDAFETMRSARSYRKTPLTKEEAIAEVKRNRGTQFDPRVVDAFLRIVDRIDI